MLSIKYQARISYKTFGKAFRQSVGEPDGLLSDQSFQKHSFPGFYFTFVISWVVSKLGSVEQATVSCPPSSYATSFMEL